jgi:uncharacterized damage-inducible protein DinB
MRRLIYTTILLSLCFSLPAQKAGKAKTEFTRMYLPIWLEAKAHCLAVANAMPADNYKFKPTAVSKTFAEQMVHIGYTVELLTKRYVEGLEVVAKTPDASTMTKAEIITLVEKGFDYVTEVIYSIEQAQLDEQTVMYHSGNTVSRAFALFYVQDHMANHRSKSNLYVRLNNIDPPEYTW